MPVCLPSLRAFPPLGRLNFRTIESKDRMYLSVMVSSFLMMLVLKKKITNEVGNLVQLPHVKAFRWPVKGK